MDNLDDKTRLMPAQKTKAQPGIARIRINYSDGGETYSRVFAETFIIGRFVDCDLVLTDDGVSRKHAEVALTDEGWIIRDLGSSNGTYVGGNQVSEMLLTDKANFHFGNENALFSVIIEPVVIEKIKHSYHHPQPQEQTMDLSVSSERNSYTGKKSNVDEVYDHYFTEKPEEEMGDHTRMVRRIIRQEQKKEQKKTTFYYKWIIVSVVVLLSLSGAFIVYQQVRLEHAQSIAVDMFYDIKTFEVQIAQTEIEAKKSGSNIQISSIALKRQKLREMKTRYQDYLSEVDFAKQLKLSLSEEDEAIVRMAKIFGECDLELSEGFISEVKKYIAKWQSSKRLTSAITRIERLGHARMVVNAMYSENLPPQFLYISLQESNFRFDAIGPKTRFGIAKGAWQFIPGTGKEYGLKIGPLASFREHDPDDERFDFEKSSYAAAKYLKKIYSTEAQASGLLVMASYNWGHNRVRRLINEMPNNPRERNFWKLTQKYKIPKETYDYVFYIFSAAVIGENPELFGFDFKNPVLMGLNANSADLN
ncbi:MAG: FHA domain-containing protein [Methylococcaceae bacterium]|nr:FHA domain-containing protein [Methylococcaceae bacterium]